MKEAWKNVLGLGFFQFIFLISAACAPGGGGSPPLSDAAIVSIYPPDNAANIPRNISIEAQFSEDLLPSTVSPSSFLVIRKNSQVAGSVSYDNSNRKIIFSPSQELDSNTLHQVQITSSIKDIQGRSLTPYSWSFMTVDNVAPFVTQTLPLNQVHLVSLDTTIKVTFSESMDPSSINDSSFLVNGNGQNFQGTFSYTEPDKTVTFTPSNPFPEFTELTVTLNTGIRDLAGVTMATNYSWSFKTLSSAPPASVLSTLPADQAVDIDIFDTQNNHPIFIEAHFSGAMEANTINPASFIVKDELGGQILGLVEYFPSDSDPFARFTPTGDYSVLAIGRVYTVTLTGMQDAYENPLQGNLGGDYVWSFKTRSGLGLTMFCEDSDFDAQNPQIAFDPVTTFFHAIWQQTTSGNTNYSIFVNSFPLYPDPSAAFQLSTGTGNAINPKIISSPNGGTFAVWEQKVNGEVNSSIVYSENLGAGWSIPQILDNDASPAQNPQIAVGPNGFPCVVWEQAPSGSTRGSIFFTQNIGGNWTSIINVEIPVSFQAPPVVPGLPPPGAKNARIVVDQNNNIIICFTQFGSVFLNNGPAWAYFMGPNIPTGPLLLNITFPYGGYPNGGYANSLWQWDWSDTLVVTESAWGQLGSPSQQIWQVLDNMGTTPVGTNYPAFPTNIVNYSLAESNGHAAVIYQQKIGTAGNYESVLVNSRPAGSAWWQSSSLLAEAASFIPAINNKKPRIAIDSTGNLFGAWEESSPGFDSAFNVAFRAISAGTPTEFLDNGGVMAYPMAGNAKIAVAPNDKVHVLFEQVPMQPPFVPQLLLRILDQGGWSAPLSIGLSGGYDAINGEMVFTTNSECHLIFQQKQSEFGNYSILANAFH